MVIEGHFPRTPATKGSSIRKQASKHQSSGCAIVSSAICNINDLWRQLFHFHDSYAMKKVKAGDFESDKFGARCIRFFLDS
ncbi:hypothetical protein L6452_31965 [Arctium lappa]|uniref:Uncharacterized protein n=1 Tax=Arctium lappa TaxID=4217 RepID=A0ACB8Z452_ARCLA|nr:hypothetical protein L6452_31965 [Arctium lappa]